MDDDKLAGFATKSKSAIDQMHEEEARLILHEAIAEAGCTEFEVTDDDLREKGMKPEVASDITSLKVKGVKITAVTDNTFSIVVTPEKYKGAKGIPVPELREGKEFDGEADEDFFIYPECTDRIIQAIEAGCNVLLIGPAGCGKTELLDRIVTKKLGRKNLPINMTEETTVDDFVGVRSLKDNGKGVMETTFTDGPLPITMQEGLVLQIDELDAAEMGILFTLQRPLEGKDLIIGKDHGRRVNPEPGWAIVATANTAGRGDQADIYRSRQILDEAFLDRWDAVFRLNYIAQSDEIKVLRRRTGIGQAVAKTLTKIATAARASFGQSIMTTFSLRKSIAVATFLAMGWTMENSFKAAVLDKCTDEDAAALAEIYQRIAKDPIDLSYRMGASEE